jgi:TolA-binding protein
MIACYAVLALATGAQTPAKSDSDEAADAILEGAKRGYNEKKHDFAAERFREFLKQFPNHPDAALASYGLGLCLIGGPKPDPAGALQALQPAANRGDLPEHGLALYHMGLAARTMGEQANAEAEAKPDQATQLRAEAKRRFEAAFQSFTSAAGALAARAGAAQRTTADRDWILRAQCDATDMLLRLGRNREAADRAAALLDEKPAPGPLADLAAYQLGHALFLCGTPVEAGRALTRLAPFHQPFGNHVRFLLARIHHAAGERPEAAALYETLLTRTGDERKTAQEALRNPNLRPDQRAAFQAAVDGPIPDFVQRSLFHLAMLKAEAGEFAEAIRHFSTFVQQHPKSPLLPEAGVRLGYCQLLAGSATESQKALQPYLEHPLLADRAHWWSGKALLAAADPKDAQAYTQSVTRAVEMMRRAADLAGQAGRTDPEAKVRRGDILMDLGDAMLAAGDARGAAGIYEQVLREGGNPDRAEESLQREITALQLARTYRESDDQCRRFEQTFPKSTLMPAVLFRSAENAYLMAVALTNQPAGPNRTRDENQLLNESVKRYRRLMERAPEFPHMASARQGLGSALHRLGQYKEAAAALSEIQPADCRNTLATVPYLLADCLIRDAPTECSDALRAAAALDNLERAAKLLEGFVAADDKSPEAADAFLKLAHCHGRVSVLTAVQAERQRLLGAQRQAFDQLIQRFPQHPSIPASILQRAACIAAQGDPETAIRELTRFQTDPLAATPMAPSAIAQLSALLRGRGRAAEAVNVIQQCRNRHETALLADPVRKSLAFELQHEHAQALKDWGKTAEARVMFEALTKQFAGQPGVANAVWKAAQCRREEWGAQQESFRRTAGRSGIKPEEVAAAARSLQEARNALTDAVAAVEDQALAASRRAPGSEAHQALLYEAAWCYRVLADAATEEARRQVQEETRERLRLRAAGQPAPPPATGPEVEIAVQATAARWPERSAEQQYRRLIAAAPASVLGARAAMELAEILLARNDLDAAADVLTDAIAQNPVPELAERLRLLLSFALLGKKDAKGALVQAQAAAAKPVSPHTAVSAKAVLGEAQCLTENWADAIKTLVPFRDHGPWQNVPGVTDRALLRLGQAQLRSGQADAGRTTLGNLAQRFPASPWVDEALFEAGLSQQAQGQYDQAVATFRTLTRRSASEWAARAQLQTGFALLEMPDRRAEAAQAFLAAYYAYDEPDLCARACWEAANVLAGLKRDNEAAALWRRMSEEFPTSTWAEQARKRLAAQP